MTRYRDQDEEDWDDEGDYADDPDADEEQTVPCPYCREEILEDSQRCPSCGQYVSAEDHPGPGKPLWVIATALICLGIAIWWVFAVV